MRGALSHSGAFLIQGHYLIAIINCHSIHHIVKPHLTKFEFASRTAIMIWNGEAFQAQMTNFRLKYSAEKEKNKIGSNRRFISMTQRKNNSSRKKWRWDNSKLVQVRDGTQLSCPATIGTTIIPSGIKSEHHRKQRTQDFQFLLQPLKPEKSRITSESTHNWCMMRLASRSKAETHERGSTEKGSIHKN